MILVVNSIYCRACIQNILQAFIENLSEVLYQKCYILFRKKSTALSTEVNFALGRFCRIISVFESDLNNYIYCQPTRESSKS